MFIVRQEQLIPFEIVKPEVFIPLMIHRLADKFPQCTQIIGQQGLTKIIEAGIIGSNKYGVETAHEVGLFIEVSVLYGVAFDSDPQLKWVSEILANTNLPPIDKMEVLSDAAEQARQNIQGVTQVYPLPQFKKIMASSFEELTGILRDTTQQEFKGFLKAFWPEKFNMIASKDMDTLFGWQAGNAETYNFKSTQTRYYYVLLMFLLGHRFNIDPQYPWIVDLLRDPEFDDEFHRASSLHFTVQKIFEELTEAGTIISDRN